MATLVAALIGFGLLDDPRVQRAIEWETAAILGEAAHRYYASGTTGPTFACVANGALPCALGAVKAVRALARIPDERRSDAVRRALEAGAEFLLSRDPLVADYPAWEGRVSSSWFKLGFPSGYVTDVLQKLEALAAAGYATDPRLDPATKWLLAKQGPDGRWQNQYAYAGKMWLEIDRQGQPSKWVTLRALAFLKARLGQP